MKRVFVYIRCLVILSGYRKEQNGYACIYQLSRRHGSVGKQDCDSIVLSNRSAENTYSKISIYRQGKLIFKDAKKDLEVIGVPYSLFAEQQISFQEEYYYIFRLFNAPDPSNYLVVKSTKDTTFIFGETESSTSEIFGDIDGDGKFEIGGWTAYCQEDEAHRCPDMSLFKVFEIDKGFPTDTLLTDVFRKLLFKK